MRGGTRQQGSDRTEVPEITWWFYLEVYLGVYLGVSLATANPLPERVTLPLAPDSQHLFFEPFALSNGQLPKHIAALPD